MVTKSDLHLQVMRSRTMSGGPTWGMMGIKSSSTIYRNGISVVSCLLIRIWGLSAYLISASGTGTGIGSCQLSSSCINFWCIQASPCRWIIILVTRTAVSVVICIGPNLRLWKPLARSSDVRSTYASQPASAYCRIGIFVEPKILPRGGSSLVSLEKISCFLKNLSWRRYWRCGE